MAFSRPKKKLTKSQRVGIAACMLGAFFLFGFIFVLPARADSPVLTGAEKAGLTVESGFGQAALGKQDIILTVASIINIVLGVLGIIAVGLIVYAGFLWMTAGGNEDKVAKAKMILRNAVIGLAITLASWGIASFIISRLSSASGSGTGAGGRGGGPGGGGIGGEEFTLKEFQTGHAGAQAANDVYLCSNLQSRFNHWLNLQGIDTARGLQPPLRLSVWKTGASGDTSGQYENLTTSEQLAVDIKAGSNILGFIPPGTTATVRGEWSINSQFEIHVPKILTDSSGEPLTDCIALGCNDRTTYFSWNFTTTDKRDEVKPVLTSAYPRLPGSREGYPDRDVDRAITFVLNFSEDIDFFTAVRADGRLNPENIKVEQLNSQTNQIVLAAISTDNFDVSASGSGLQFALNQSHQSSLNDGPYLEPYTWYRITVQGLTDLCGNVLDRGPVQWIFQTNGNIPGVAFVYPADKYQFACPSTETFVQFRTSMYDIKRTSCAVSPTNGGLVTSGQGINGRTLAVADDLSPQQEGEAPINPNNFCKRYDFTPATQALSVNTEYKPEVSYRNPKNDAQTEKVNWSFAVKPAAQCANAPYISALSPSTGPWGRCLTIQGNYFANNPGGDGGDTNRQGSDAYVKLNLDSGRNKILIGPAGDTIRASWTEKVDYKDGLALAVADANWFNTYLTDEMPNVKDREALPGSTKARETGTELILLPPGTDGIVDFNFFVVRKAGGAIGDLTSNLAAFAVPTKEPAYQGPCLYSLQPNVGQWQDPVVLRGVKFLPLNQRTKTAAENVFFNDGVLLANTNINNWQAEEIRTVVPNNAAGGLVKVLTGAGLSNGIRFDVANSRGGPCTDDSQCSSGLVCRNNICTKPAPPAGFRIEQAWPAGGCNNVCVNAEIGLQTNLAIKEASVAAATYGANGARNGGSIAVRQCKKSDCRELEELNLFSGKILSESDTQLTLSLSSPLARQKSYRVLVYSPVDKSGLLGITQDGDKTLASLNYDSNFDGVNDSYSWSFTAGKDNCAVDRVDTSPAWVSLYDFPPGEKVVGAAYSRADSCSPNGQKLSLSAADVAWKSCQYNVGDIQNECVKTCATAEVSVGKGIIGFAPDNAPETVISGANGTTSGARALACLFYGAGAIKDATIVTVRSRCETDTQCNLSDDDDAINDCPGSTCNLSGPNAGRCTPIISASSPSPSSGAPGTWVTLNGCYFGNRPGEVKFNNTTLFEFPAAQCSSSVWSDKQIIAEAPAGIAGSGKLKVTENRNQNSQSAESAAAFTVDNTVHPGLCRVEPGYGKAGASVKLIGKNFGEEQGVDDKVKFTHKIGLAEIIAGYITDTDWIDSLISVPVPSLAVVGENTIKVLKKLIESNPLDFRVLATPPGEPPPTATDLRVSNYQPGAGKLACLNMIVQVTFDGLVDGGSLTLGHVASTTPGKFFVRKTGGGTLDGEVWLDYPSPASTTLSFIPDRPFDKNAQYQIVIKSGGTGLLSESGGQLVAGGLCPSVFAGECVIEFTTISGTSAENAQCAAAGLQISPTNPYFTCAGEGCEGDFQPSAAGHQRQFRAILEAKNGQPLSPAGAGFIWSSADAGVVALPASLPAAKEITATIGNKNGKSRVSVVLQGTEGPKQIEGASDVTVFLCKNPWPALPANGLFQPYRDSSAPATNFSTYYCRDRGAADTGDDLPEFTGPVVNTARQGVEGLLKELFFTEATSKDAIGLRALANIPHYSTGEWYNRQIFTKGAPSPLTLDGYEALRDGRTVYVSAPNQSATGNLYTNIYLLSYNDGANADTVNIANQMVENMSFAVNIADPLEKDKLRRDVKRWTDALILSGALAAESAPVKLQSGTFIVGKSVSVWPSWQDTLGKALGGRLPTDPENKVICPAKYDKKTCFNKDESTKFVCDATAGSQAYFYRYQPPVAGSQILGTSILGFNLEYARPNKWVINANGDVLTAPWFEVAGDDTWCANLEYRLPYE